MSTPPVADIAYALRRKVYREERESDDEPVDMVSNRGNKLRKRAKYVHEGQLAPSSSAALYQTITYGDEGYRRDIISHVPPLLDHDGYEIDPEDLDGRELNRATAEASQSYPYANIQIEELLAPLTVAGNLHLHPTLSTAFTSPILTHLTENACTTLHKERASLWNLKHLLTRLGGDHTWISTGMMEGEDDLNLFPDDRAAIRDNLYTKQPLVRLEEVRDISTEGTLQSEHQYTGHRQTPPLIQEGIVDADLGTKRDTNKNGLPKPAADIPMEDAPAHTPKTAHLGSPVAPVFSPISPIQTQAENQIDTSNDLPRSVPEPDPDETLVDDSTILEDDIDDPSHANGADHDENMEDDANEDEEADPNKPSPRRMRTRARAQPATTPSRSPSPTPSDTSSSNVIDPYYLPPSISIPLRDCGLPSDESAEVRRILQLYIQKQEEVVRACDRIYISLLKAERLRKTVFEWAKQEAHVGEMSDGEDWYDPKEWGLEADELRKGCDEEEEGDDNNGGKGEPSGKGGKKTRARRQ